ncbi:MAG: PEGA domain-containing protein [Planctomycetota bacterium]|nr:hypothetical protein [Planctomycetota bacterium]MEE3054043.1 PEGA domain-containing protein [Planctomycetota bacterium]|tara:strand:- start:43 stop:468 length:426 start_codon:yes stop_codon:yes gene_type:complete
MDRWIACLIAVFALLLLSGCVQRVLRIESDPPGASVYVNGKAAGKTPLEHPFDFYGEFEIVLRHTDHQSKRIVHEASPPWYAYFPMDMIVEFLLPIFPLHDVHRIEASLQETGKIDDALRKELDTRVRSETREGDGGTKKE